MLQICLRKLYVQQYGAISQEEWAAKIRQNRPNVLRECLEEEQPENRYEEQKDCRIISHGTSDEELSPGSLTRFKLRFCINRSRKVCSIKMLIVSNGRSFNRRTGYSLYEQLVRGSLMKAVIDLKKRQNALRQN